MSWQRPGGCPQTLLSHSPAHPHQLHCHFPLQLLIRSRRPSRFLPALWLPPLLLMVPSWPCVLPSPPLPPEELESGLGSGRNQAGDPEGTLRARASLRGLDYLSVGAPSPPPGHMPGWPAPCLQMTGTAGFRTESTSSQTEITKGIGRWCQDKPHPCLPPGLSLRPSRK